MKQCTKCNKFLPEDRFYKRTSGNLRSECITCSKVRAKKVKKKSPEKTLAYAKSYRERNKSKLQIKKLEKYGLTQEEYDKLLETNEGKCHVCDTRSKRSLCIDHSHKDGSIRGLLCTNCNLALGQVKDNVDTLNKMIKYVEGSKW